MKLSRSENNNAIIVRLQNVRKHPNADRLKLATVLGTQVIVSLEAKEDDLMVYFDSNLRLSHAYLHHNNLYSSPEMNIDTTKKGYFGKNGKVRAQKFRGELSNGYVADIDSLFKIPELFNDAPYSPRVGDEFTHIDGIEFCSKFVVTTRIPGAPGSRKDRNQMNISSMFIKHWNTKHLMRENHNIPERGTCYLEEKVHGTSGRIGNMLCYVKSPWWNWWAPKEEWRVVGETRNVDNTNHHCSLIRKEIE